MAGSVTLDQEAPSETELAEYLALATALVERARGDLLHRCGSFTAECWPNAARCATRKTAERFLAEIRVGRAGLWSAWLDYATERLGFNPRRQQTADETHAPLTSDCLILPDVVESEAVEEPALPEPIVQREVARIVEEQVESSFAPKVRFRSTAHRVPEEIAAERGLLTLRQVAHRLGVKYGTVMHAVRYRQLRPVGRLGVARAMLFSPKDVDAFGAERAERKRRARANAEYRRNRPRRRHFGQKPRTPVSELARRAGLLTVSQVATKLGISYPGVRRLVRAEAFPVAKVVRGRAQLFAPSAVRAFMRSPAYSEVLRWRNVQTQGKASRASGYWDTRRKTYATE